MSLFTMNVVIHYECLTTRRLLVFPVPGHPAPAGAGAAPPKKQGNREARSAIYATAAVPIFDHDFFALPRGVPVSNCFNGLLRALTKNSL